MSNYFAARIVRTTSLAMLLALMLTTLVACGGGSSNKSSVPDTTAPQAPLSPFIKIISGGKISISGKAEPTSTIKAAFSDGSNIETNVDREGNYTLVSNNTQSGNLTLTATDAAGNTSTETISSIPLPIIKNGALIFKNPLTKPISGIAYNTPFYNGSGITKNNGSFTYKEGETSIDFSIAGRIYRVSPSDKVDTNKLLGSNPNPIELNHLKLILINLDKDNNTDNGIDLSSNAAKNANINPSTTNKAIKKALYKATGNNPKLIYSPSLGVNTEAPQAEADTAGQAMPFVDIFRTARPFAELSASATEFDENGWPTKLDPASNPSNSARLFARTKLLQGTLADAIPSGKYTILYDGNGDIEIGGRAISKFKKISNQTPQTYTFDLTLIESDSADTNEINLNILNIAPGEGNYIKNIRIIMPGGTCKTANDIHNPFIQVSSQSECPENTQYESFVDQLKNKDRNTIDSIVFNPDYLSFLREFKVVRMMNLMESSHGLSSCAIKNNGLNEIDKDCIKEPIIWDDRATLSDSVWGGSGRTPHTKRNGVPVEVVVSLANTLKRDLWVNMPHSADDDYISSFADYLSTSLEASLKAYVEYSNETWNPGFLGHFYVEAKGIEAGLNTVPSEFSGFREKEYFARLRFYSQRSVEIFNLWKAAFNGSTDRLVRVLGTNQGDKVLSEQMIKHIENKYGANNVDAIAMAPYFFGCTQNTGSCSDAPKVFKNALSVDDVFDIIDQDVSVDPSAMSGTVAKIKLQSDITSQYNLQLLSYEGGQHLTTSILGRLELSESEKATFRALFKKANRDPRMKQRYETLLNSWKSFENKGATLFTMYTLPQSFYRFGNWGLKEHLNKTRNESPKYDGVMTFQESVGKCWWEGCEN